MTLIHDKEYWDTRWKKDETGWDIGEASTPLKSYFEQLENKNVKILIPGAGNAYEAELLHKLGFSNVWVLDIAPEAISSFKIRVPDFPQEHLLCANFFEIQDQFELMIEQTFFCALNPAEREKYCKKAKELITPGGKLVGLLFNIELFKDQPPYGGNEKECRPLFEKYFTIVFMEKSHNSIGPRANNELFIKMIRE